MTVHSPYPKKLKFQFLKNSPEMGKFRQFVIL
jgi:hypothetical protein